MQSDNQWQESLDRIERYAMPVGRDNRRKAASKKTYRSMRAGRKVAKAINGIHRRRQRGKD
jgi:hypothetical protein